MIKILDMTKIDSMNTTKADGLHNKCIYIIGPSSFQNEFIKYFLNKELGVKCVINGSIECIQNCDDAENTLILLDISDNDMKKLLIEREPGYSRLLSSYFVALFNMDNNTGIEKEAMRCGIRGFFYINDTKEQFLKGIQVIFKGELWISRNVLSKYILEKVNLSPSFKQPITSRSNHNLTRREIEILAMVSVGARNDEIAKKLCISPHTVKTHLYNVFKKIKVTGRLQAALWAAKKL